MLKYLENGKCSYTVVAFLSGFSAILTQLLLIRELLTVFSGVEIILSLIFAVWLVGVGAGSITGTLFIKILSEKWIKRSLATLNFVLGILVPLSLCFGRISREFLTVYTGEYVSFSSTVLITFMVLFPVCLIIGLVFTFLTHVYKNEVAVRDITKIYVMESAGSLCGGLSFTFVFVTLLNPVAGAFVCTALLIVNFLLLIGLRLFYSFLIAFLVFIFIFPVNENIEKKILFRKWQKFNSKLKLLESVYTKYGNIAVLEFYGQKNFYQDGHLIFSIPNEIDAEDYVHLTLIQKPDAEKVLLLSGGITGIIKEVLKYKSISKIDYVELDSALIQVAKKYMSEENRKALNSPKVNIINTDARFFVKEKDELYDFILSSLPEPANAGLNRFYTIEFFKEIRNILKSDGVFAFSLPSSENYMSKEMRDLNVSIYRTLKRVFKYIKVIPGSTAIFFASNKDIVTFDANTLAVRFEKCKLKTKYFTKYHYRLKLIKSRIESLRKILNTEPGRLNTDLLPITYFLNMMIWTKYSGSKLLEKLKNIKFVSGYTLVWVLVLLLICFIILYFKTKTLGKINIFFVNMLVTGFCGMLFSVLILFSFQNSFGYLYGHIGILIASFMAGITLSSYIVSNLSINHKTGLIINEVCIILCSVVIFHVLKNASYFRELILWFVYLFMMFISGVFIGAQYPLINNIVIEKLRLKKGISAGLSYGGDLFGSALGSLVTGSFIIPLVGLLNTLKVVVVLKLFSLVLVLVFFLGLNKIRR